MTTTKGAGTDDAARRAEDARRRDEARRAAEAQAKAAQEAQAKAAQQVDAAKAQETQKAPAETPKTETETKKPVEAPMSANSVQKVAVVQEERGRAAQPVVGKLPLDTKATLPPAAANTAGVYEQATKTPASATVTPTTLTEKTKTALAKDATVEQRREAAEQFTEGFGFKHLFGADRDTTVDKGDLAQARLLHQRESLRADADPGAKQTLEQKMLEGVNAGVQQRDPKAADEVKAAANDLAFNPSYSPATRRQAFSAYAKTEGLVDDKGAIKPEQASKYAERARAVLDETQGQDKRPQLGVSSDMPLRREASSALYAAASTATGDKRAELLRAGDDIARNRPSNAEDRAIVDGLASGKINPALLTKNDADRALATLEKYPPRNSMPMGHPDAAAAWKEAGGEFEARSKAKDALVTRTKELGDIYQRNGWSKDSDLLPGRPPKDAAPARDQAVVVDLADRARQNTTAGQPITAASFAKVSPVDTQRGLQAIENLRAANPTIFGATPPKDAASQETRTRIEDTQRALARHAAVQNLTMQVDGLEKGFDKVLADRGVVGRFADFTKNAIGSDVGSDAVAKDVKAVADEKQKLEQLRDFKGDDAAFDKALRERAGGLHQKLTGAAEHIGRFQESQKTWVDTTTDIAAVAVGVGAVVAAPVTGGASLVLGGAVAAATKVGTKALDAATGSGSYQGSIVGDAAVSFLGGASGAGALQLSRAVGSKIASSLGASQLAATTSFLVGESVAGAVDGGITGSGSALLRGESLETAAQHGVKSAALGALIGPLVGGTIRGTGALARSIRDGATPPPRIPFSEAGDVAAAQLQRAGVDPAKLGVVQTRALAENGTPFARLKPDGSVEIGLPVRADGTVARGAVAHETEHLRQIAEARATGKPALVENLQAAQRQAGEVERLERAVTEAPDAAARKRIAGELDSARSAYANNPVERQARAAGLNAEADAIAKTNPSLAQKMRARATELTAETAAPVSTTRAMAPDSLKLSQNPASVAGEMEPLIREEAQEVMAELRHLNQFQEGGKLTLAKSDAVDAIFRPAEGTNPGGKFAQLQATARDEGIDLARVMSPAIDTGLVAGKAAKAALSDIDTGFAQGRRSIETHVGSEAEAREVLNELLKKQPLVETTGLNARIGRGIGNGNPTFHWDTQKLPNGTVVGHAQVGNLRHQTTPHLQIDGLRGADIHIFIEPAK